MRSIAGELLGFNPMYFRSKFDRTAVPELQELLHRHKRPEEKYPALAPLLFPGRDPKNKNPLAVEELAKVSLYLIHISRVTNYRLASKDYSTQCLLVEWR